MKLCVDHPSRRPRVEMLPLIDVVFLLLVFFIYAMLSMVTHRGLEVNLPVAASAVPDDREYIAITLTPAGDVLLNDRLVALDELAAGVCALRAASAADMPVFIQGDRDAGLGLAVRILDRLAQAGIREVFFACLTNE